MAATAQSLRRIAVSGASSSRWRLASAVGGGRPWSSAAYTGEEGSLSSIAAMRIFKDAKDPRLVGVPSIKAVFEAVANEEVLYGVVPIENSASGSLPSTYDNLVKHNVVIGAELGVRETYCLCSRPGVQAADIASVMSHPNVLDACSTFIGSRLRKTGLDLTATRTTTEATRLVASGGDENCSQQGPTAAIATRLAAERQGLEVLAEDIGNDALLQTRYILIHGRTSEAAARPPPFPHDLVLQGMARKRSAGFVLRNESGALSKLLSNFAMRGIDIIKIESRPMHADLPVNAGTAFLWDFLLYVDFAVPPWQTEVEAARLWEALTEFSLWQSDFGTYPSHVPRDLKQQQSWNEMVDIMTKG